MAKISHVTTVLSDFFDGNTCVTLAQRPGGFNGPSYIPSSSGILIRSLAKENKPLPEDVLGTAHEIGHFVLAPIERLGLVDYGYKTTFEQWPIKAWEMELDVIARQICILRRHKRHYLVNFFMGFLSGAVPRYGQKYIAAHEKLTINLAAAEETHRSWVMEQHLREVIDQRIYELSGGYNGIVGEFRKRCDLFQSTVILQAA